MIPIDIQSLARENVKSLKPYSSARDDFEGTASVFLDANENPFPTDYNRYPDPHQRLLKEIIAQLKNLKSDQLFLGNGSDETIDLLFRAFCEPGRDMVGIPQPTYGMYAVSAGVNNVKVISTSLTNSFDLDSKVVLKSTSPHTKLIFLCSPNNPSGNLLDVKEIEVILKNFPGLVIVDEAYIDFAASASWTTRLDEFQNLVVLQTFSKAWGLAGLRLGMCFANPEIITVLNKIKPPYNINSFTQSEALKSLNLGKSEMNRMVTAIKHEREVLRKHLHEVLAVKKVHPSDANFLLVEVTDAKKSYEHLVSKSIIVRNRSMVVLCDNCLRITVGTKEENDLLIQAMRLL